MIELEEKHQPPELNSEGAFRHGKAPSQQTSRPFYVDELILFSRNVPNC